MERPPENGRQRGSTGAVRGVAGARMPLILALVLCGMTAWGGGLGGQAVSGAVPAAGGLYAALGPGAAVDLCP